MGLVIVCPGAGVAESSGTTHAVAGGYGSARLCKNDGSAAAVQLVAPIAAATEPDSRFRATASGFAQGNLFTAVLESGYAVALITGLDGSHGGGR